jgi:potassium-transporting ATPase KdpC subunit
MLASIPREILTAIRLTLVFGLVTGILYPLAFTGVSQVFFHDAANGSLIVRNGQVVGSSLIGQQFTADRYFQGRVSATATPYAADNSAGSNLGPSNPALIDRVASSARAYRAANGLGPNDPVPVDAVTADFTGFDPDISEANALLQANRVARARGLDPAKVRALVERYVHGRVLWIFGEPHVSVLEVNLALDRGEAG